jgi:transposase-like protein
MSTAPTPVLIGVRDAARQLGVHENTLRRWERTGIVRAVRLPSGVRRFRAQDIAGLQDEIYGASGDAALDAAAASLRSPAGAR